MNAHQPRESPAFRRGEEVNVELESARQTELARERDIRRRVHARNKQLQKRLAMLTYERDQAVRELAFCRDQLQSTANLVALVYRILEAEEPG